MTKLHLKTYLQKDIKKIKRERKAQPERTGTHQNETTLTYLVAREHTLVEILNKLK